MVNYSDIPFRLLQQVRHRIARSTLDDEDASIFPYSGVYDEEMTPLLIPDIGSDLGPSCRSHRLVLEKEGKPVAAFVKSASRGRLLASIDICPRRLIDTHTLKIVEFGQDDIIPSYAILSHRWTEEVVYAEYLQPLPETKSKPGYQKIEAGCRQARQDGIRYFWIDTCCINQGDPADVAANITSMFAYYQNAEVCYTYLADVESRYYRDTFGEPRLFTVLGEGSEWFRRGWTLQELVAPRTMIFFSKDWQYLGDKLGLRNDISHITAIPPTVLSGAQSLKDVDVLTRATWSVWRTTTKQQDGAYCLQGLLGVTVEPDYNEHYGMSFNRLGMALLDAYPDLHDRLEFSSDPFRNPNGKAFFYMLWCQLLSLHNNIHYVGTSLGAVLFHIMLLPVTILQQRKDIRVLTALLTVIIVVVFLALYLHSESPAERKSFIIQGIFLFVLMFFPFVGVYFWSRKYRRIYMKHSLWWLRV